MRAQVRTLVQAKLTALVDPITDMVLSAIAQGLGGSPKRQRARGVPNADVAVLGALKGHPKGLARREILEATGMTKGQLEPLLRRLRQEKKIILKGDRKQSRYFLAK